MLATVAGRRFRPRNKRPCAREARRPPGIAARRTMAQFPRRTPRDRELSKRPAGMDLIEVERLAVAAPLRHDVELTGAMRDGGQVRAIRVHDEQLHVGPGSPAHQCNATAIRRVAGKRERRPFLEHDPLRAAGHALNNQARGALHVREEVGFARLATRPDRDPLQCQLSELQAGRPHWHPPQIHAARSCRGDDERLPVGSSGWCAADPERSDVSRRGVLPSEGTIQ